MARYNFGPALVDFAPLANIGKSYQSAFDAQRKRALDDERRETFASLGTSAAPDYTKTGLALLGMGDVASGAALIGLGQKADERKLEAEAIRSWGGGTPAAATPPPASSAGGGTPSLIQNESGGRWDAQNDAVGAGGQKGHFGRLQFGQARLQEAQAAGAIPPGTTPQAFMQSPELQQRAEQWHFADIDQNIKQNGFDRLVGQRLNGVPVTIDGMRAVAHLGGKEGLRKFLETGGQYNPADENGTRLSDYFTRHGGGGAQPAQVAAQGSQRAPVQIAETEADVQRLEAQRGDPQVGGGTYAQSPTAELQAFLQNPRVPDNMKVMMQEELARRSGGQAPVQMAEAAPQPGAPVSDIPAQGASPAQGFAIPQALDVPTSIAQDPKVQLWSQRLATSPTERMRTVAKQQLDLAVKDVERRLESSKLLTPEQEAQKIRLAQAGRTTINNTNQFDAKGETKFNEALGSAQAKRWNDYIEEGDKAQTRIADIQTLRETSRRLGSQGSQANLKSLIGPYAESLGINIEGLSDIQTYESITNRLAPQLRAPGSGSTSDIEFKGFMRAIGPLSNTPAAREMILDTFEAASRNDLARSEIASRLASGEIQRGQAEKELRALPSPLEGFRKFREANPDLVGQAIKEAGMRNSAEKRDPIKVMSPEEARKLPRGTRIILPDGSPGVIP